MVANGLSEKDFCEIWSLRLYLKALVFKPNNNFLLPLIAMLLFISEYHEFINYTINYFPTIF